MRSNCVEAAERLARRAQGAGLVGNAMPQERLAELEGLLGFSLPPWLRDVFTRVALCGVPLGLQARPPSEDSDGVLFVEWATADDIRSESVDCYPGLAIRRLGYVNVAGNDGSGDPLFVCVHDGDDPPVYRVYHDVSDVAEEIVARGRKLVAQSLSDFFEKAIVRPT